jgi:TM2 domain-containing membrane protein YozV
VQGVELLRQRSRHRNRSIFQRKYSPYLAAGFSLILPGLGAAYNGQVAKAILHFALFSTFFHMATITRGAPFFSFAIFFIYLFAVVDAYRTAQLIRSGTVPEMEQDAILTKLFRNPLTWGISLILLGSISLLHTFFNVTLLLRDLIPITILIIGILMVFDHFRRPKGTVVPDFDSNYDPLVAPGSAKFTPSTTGRSGERLPRA